MLQSLDPTKAAYINSEVDSFLTRRQKSNRKLTRDVAQWVETAMQISAEKKSSTSGGGAGSMDVDDITIDFGDEEEYEG